MPRRPLKPSQKQVTETPETNQTYQQVIEFISQKFAIPPKEVEERITNHLNRNNFKKKAEVGYTTLQSKGEWNYEDKEDGSVIVDVRNNGKKMKLHITETKVKVLRRIATETSQHISTTLSQPFTGEMVEVHTIAVGDAEFPYVLPLSYMVTGAYPNAK